ncbi:MAG: zinc-binding dehydrogenase [Chitinophagaceae bacterium]|nr:MAG: zinc-binding dehydrogenase [Chitinophagaceae bacterium]
MNRSVYSLKKAGSFKNLHLTTENLADPQKDEVQISVKAIGLNFADIFAIQGLYSATPKGIFIPGLEFSGMIHKVGKDVTDYKIGDRVMGVTRFGAYADFLNIDADYVFRLPEDWSFSEGAAFPVQAITAYYALFNLGDLRASDTVLIHSAAGGVGLLANRLAKKAGAYTIGTVSSVEKIELLKKENYDAYIVRDKNFENNLQQAIKGRELNLILECIGGEIFKTGYKLLTPMGRIVVYGAATFAQNLNSPNPLKLLWKYLNRPVLDPLKMMSENKSVMAFNLIWLYDKKAFLKSVFREVVNQNLQQPLVGHEFEFKNMMQALELFRSGKTSGKVIVKV